MATKELRINRQIMAKEVLVIDQDNQKNLMKFFDALQLAQDTGLDLVEVSGNANPPVCKIMDYGKYRYEQEKKAREQARNQNIIKLREIRMQPKIDTHDLETKTKAISAFIGDGDKCKVTIRFKSRELAHPEMGKMVLDKILELLTEKGLSYQVESQAQMEGRTMSMLLGPRKK
ncbi:MAG: translation initiation factor IF-3 [Sphaerochaetaceae bacterium]|nr:translation initiation factor IF-3 [Sphaerochaetaceae bacterium]